MSENAPPPPKKKKTPQHKETLRGAFIELLKVRTIITLIIVSTVSYLAIREKIATEAYMAIGSAVVTYYFTRNKSDDK